VSRAGRTSDNTEFREAVASSARFGRSTNRRDSTSRRRCIEVVKSSVGLWFPIVLAVISWMSDHVRVTSLDAIEEIVVAGRVAALEASLRRSARSCTRPPTPRAAQRHHPAGHRPNWLTLTSSTDTSVAVPPLSDVRRWSASKTISPKRTSHLIVSRQLLIYGPGQLGGSRVRVHVVRAFAGISPSLRSRPRFIL
jgi:hypothetical protein